jgi:putative transposase
METVIGLFKTECIHTTVFHYGPHKTIADVEYAAMGWVNWDNTRRLHSSIGFLTPLDHEAAYYAALTPEPQPV